MGCAGALYVLCGLPFAGKTHLAAELAARLGFAVVSIDEIKFAHGFPWTDDSPITSADWARILDEADGRTAAFVAEGRTVVYDCANLDRETRAGIREFAASIGCPCRLVFVDAPVETVRQRWRHNRRSRERFDLPEAVFESALAAFERPAPDEAAVPWDGTMDVSAWATRHLGREAAPPS